MGSDRINLRPATAGDQKSIVAIIREAHLNPMDLKWSNFVVAVDEASGDVVGTGQVKAHRDGSRELASIATVPAYQRRGIARRIVERLLAEHPDTLYLTCQSTLGPFYEQFGFRAIGEEEWAPYFRRLKKLAGVFELLSRGDVTLLVMKRDG